MNISLIGFKNCGKTTIGKELAYRNKMNFIDTDIVIQEKYKEIYGSQRPIVEIYQTLGQTGFRQLESEVIKELTWVKNTVIATGGGVILNNSNIILLRKIGCIIFLEISLTTALERAYKKGKLNKVFLGRNKTIEGITYEFISRLNVYRSVAETSVCVDNLNKKIAVEKIIKNLNAYGQ